MSTIITLIKELIQKVLSIGIAGVVIAALASEIKLAALKKASQGSVRLSGFTQKMTKLKVNY